MSPHKSRERQIGNWNCCWDCTQRNGCHIFYFKSLRWSKHLMWLIGYTVLHQYLYYVYCTNRSTSTSLTWLAQQESITLTSSYIWIILCVVYFYQCLDAAHSKCGSTYAISIFFCKKAEKSWKKLEDWGKNKQMFMFWFAPKHWSRVIIFLNICVSENMILPLLTCFCLEIKPSTSVWVQTTN